MITQLPELMLVDAGAFRWTELPGIECKPIRMADIVDAMLTQDFAENGPAPQVTQPLPVFTPNRAKPAMAGLMVTHDGKVGGVGFRCE
jgi:hypothetical protein